MFCLAGIGGQQSGFVQMARDVPDMVVIDGCLLGCANASLEQAQVPMKPISFPPTSASRRIRT
jgi:uncharacterized metal-binding protein